MLIRRISRTSTILAAVLAFLLAGTLTGTAAPPAASSSPGDHPAARQLLFFNHAYGVFDRETADAIEHSGYLRHFANFQVRTVTGSDGQVWTGRYLLGRTTYVELFGVGDLPGKDGEPGSAGMAVSVERSGDLATVIDRLPGLGVTDPLLFQQTRDFGDGVPVPWFDGVFTTGEYDTFGTWGMEYRPEYFADPRGNTEPPAYPGDVGRERYLPDDYQDRLMRDVTKIRLAVTARDLGNTVPLLSAGGFTVKSVPGGALALRGDTTLAFEVVPVGETGLRGIDMSLNRPVSHRHVEQLGTSTLVVGPGSRAVWTFAAS
ncbi:DUF5829 family protein [Saccharomonospora sp. NPDC006951]